MMTKFDLEKCQRNEQGHYLCQTRDGRPARVVCTDLHGNNGRTLLALVKAIHDGGEDHRSFNADGTCCPSHNPLPGDLVNIPTKREGWINIYPGALDQDKRVMSGWATKAEADKNASVLRIACIKIEWEE